MDKDFLLETETARELYHQYAEPMPIIDYHCHLSPREIYEDRQFDNIAEVWLGGDHYKWRIMRAMGVEERYITGDAPDREKFQKWAETISYAIGNPLFHWSHLELKNYFGYKGVLNAETAQEVWELCNEKLHTPAFSARNLIRCSNVRTLCTTDDPADTLEWHGKIKESGFEVDVRPAFRPDRFLFIEKDGFAGALSDLEKYGTIETYEDLKKVLRKRLDFFHEMGCRVSDHGMDEIPFTPAPEKTIEAVFRKRRSGEALSGTEILQYKTDLLTFFGREYNARGWVMQLHYGVIRDNSKRIYRMLGADAGIDSIGDKPSVRNLVSFLNALDETDELPKTILYSLDPCDNAAIDSVIACFQGGCRGKIQHGSAWWFNDHKKGMEEQLSTLASGGMLCTFVGMLTDSRSFLSYARHEYFRRILCNLIGGWVESGQFPKDEKILQEIVEGICYENAVQYFGFGQ